MLSKEEILKCPFCNGEPVLTERGNSYSKKRSTEIKCTNCGVEMIVGAISNSLEWCRETVI
jgi:transcription elongation factor Elf1